MTAPGGSGRIEVVEVLGFGRSGSTLLDGLLANALGAPSTGELVAVWRRGLLEDRHCSCGRRFSRCPFWTAVVETDATTLTRRRAAEVVLDTNRVMRVWSPWRVRTATARRALVDAVPARWFEAMGALYRGVAVVTRSSTIVDSSKAPVLAFLLAQIPELRVRPVPLVRDPRAVAWAWSHPGPPVALAPALPQLSPARAAIVWSFVTAAAGAVTAALGDGVPTVAYERLVAAPEATVAQIVQSLRPGADPGAGAEAAPAPGPAHTMSGNPRLRFAADLPVVRPDERWKDDISPGTWCAVSALTLPGLVRHGYPLRPPRRGGPGAAGRPAAPSAGVAGTGVAGTPSPFEVGA